MITSRSRVIAAPRERVWELVGDPYHHPRWWPRVERVEGVTARGWTNVLDLRPRQHGAHGLDRGRATSEPVERRWTQEVEGTPFERLFVRNTIAVRLDKRGRRDAR